MVVYMTRDFYRLFRKADIGEKKLNGAIREICAGNVIPLGHKVYKKRIGSRFCGKRGGYRTILYYCVQQRIIFMYLYAKNVREDISAREKKAYMELATAYDSMDEVAILRAINDNKLVRWNYEQQ